MTAKTKDSSWTRGETSPDQEAGRQTRAPSRVGWSQRPATGRSFVMTMVVALVASGVAVLLATRPRPEQRTDRAAEMLERRLEAP